MPGVLLGGTYIGSKCWPSAGTWTIDYQAPCKLYVWAREGEYNAGVNDLLSAYVWAREAAEGFQRSDGAELHLWSRHFVEGAGNRGSFDQSISRITDFVGTDATSCFPPTYDFLEHIMVPSSCFVNLDNVHESSLDTIEQY